MADNHGKSWHFSPLYLHQLPKELVLSKSNENLYVLGVMDDRTRCVWLILLDDKKSTICGVCYWEGIGRFRPALRDKEQSDDE